MAKRKNGSGKVAKVGVKVFSDEMVNTVKGLLDTLAADLDPEVRDTIPSDDLVAAWSKKFNLGTRDMNLVKLLLKEVQVPGYTLSRGRNGGWFQNKMREQYNASCGG